MDDQTHLEQKLHDYVCYSEKRLDGMEKQIKFLTRRVKKLSHVKAKKTRKRYR